MLGAGAEDSGAVCVIVLHNSRRTHRQTGPLNKPPAASRSSPLTCPRPLHALTDVLILFSQAEVNREDCREEAWRPSARGFREGRSERPPGREDQASIGPEMVGPVDSLKVTMKEILQRALKKRKGSQKGSGKTPAPCSMDMISLST